VLGAYGKALADAGRLKEASTVLANAHTPERPNWSILSAQGSVADQLGDHKQAQNYYKAAIRMRPDEPSVMSNLGLSYALNKQLPQAEETLRDAANNPKADMRIRQNLALVLALEGKFGEAENWSRRDLAPIDAADNVASIRNDRAVQHLARFAAVRPSGAAERPGEELDQCRGNAPGEAGNSREPRQRGLASASGRRTRSAFAPAHRAPRSSSGRRDRAGR
jgi:tetratricopeptide (TPR) repeat protein